MDALSISRRDTLASASSVHKSARPLGRPDTYLTNGTDCILPHYRVYLFIKNYCIHCHHKLTLPFYSSINTVKNDKATTSSPFIIKYFLSRAVPWYDQAWSLDNLIIFTQRFLLYWSTLFRYWFMPYQKPYRKWNMIDNLDLIRQKLKIFLNAEQNFLTKLKLEPEGRIIVYEEPVE